MGAAVVASFTFKLVDLGLTVGKVPLLFVSNDSLYIFIQSVPLTTEPGISLIILPLMRIFQPNFKPTYITVQEM